MQTNKQQHNGGRPQSVYTYSRKTHMAVAGSQVPASGSQRESLRSPSTAQRAPVWALDDFKTGKGGAGLGL